MSRIVARTTLLLIALAVLAAASFAPLAAQEATPVPGSLALPPNAVVGGLSVGEWSARSWQWQFSFPVAANPVLDATGEQCSYGQTGPVFFLVPSPIVADPSQPRDVTRHCTIPTGVALLVPILTTECSTVEPPPSFGQNEAELRQCAKINIDSASAQVLKTLTLTVDGQPVTNLTSHRASSPLFSLYLPAGNMLHLPGPLVANSVSDGYWVLLAPLPAGSHQVAFTWPSPEGPATTTYQLTVAAAQVAGAEAPPTASPGG